MTFLKNASYVLFLFGSCCLLSCEHDSDQYPIKGIDVSHYQLQINWEEVAKNEDVHFVFMKATEGANYQDSTFLRNWEGAAKAGLKRGAYHFFYPKASADEQVENFKNLVVLDSNDLPPVLDVEGIEPNLKNLEKIKTWLIFIEAHYGVQPIVYANMKFYQAALKAAFPDYRVWIARYNNNQPPKELQWLFWQYSDKGQVKGIAPAVDLNVFDGTLEELMAL